MTIPRQPDGYPWLRFPRGVVSMGNIPASSGIYRILCPVLKRAYVGQAWDLAKRCLEHQVDLRQGVHTNSRLQQAYKAYGPGAFQFQVLEYVTLPYAPDALSPAEQRHMDAHPGSLFNVRPAGSDEYIIEARRRAARLGLTKKVGGKSSSPSGDAGSKKNAPSRPGPSANKADSAPSRPLGRGKGLRGKQNKGKLPRDDS